MRKEVRMIDLKDVEAAIKNRRVVVTTNDRGYVLTGWLVGTTKKKGRTHLIFEDRHEERVEGPLSKFSYYPDSIRLDGSHPERGGD